MLGQTKDRRNLLKLFGALKTLDTRLHDSTTNGWGNADFIFAVIDDEYVYRQQQKTRRLIASAKFRTDTSFEKHDVTAKQNLTKGQITDLKNLTFMHCPRNILILGPTGVGKTFLATAIGHQACR